MSDPTHKMTAGHRVVFLNLDGVVHYPASLYDRRRKEMLMAADGYELFEWARPLEQLAEQYDLHFVLRTSWLLQMTLIRVLDYMPPALAARVFDFTEPVAEITPWGPVRIATRYQVVGRFVAKHCINRWLAIDDSAEGWPPGRLGHLVLCESRRGLSCPATVKELDQALAKL